MTISIWTVKSHFLSKKLLPNLYYHYKIYAAEMGSMMTDDLDATSVVPDSRH